MTRICTICARGGSKGVPRKNIRVIAGRPLIGWTIQQAKQSGLFDLIAVSSDSPQILQAAKDEGADLTVKRPVELASDNSGKAPAIRHCLIAGEQVLGYNADTLVDLDVTSPLRLVEDIEGAVNLLEKSQVSNVITGAPARRSPYFNLVERDAKGTIHLAKSLPRPVLRRQDAPACFDMNASIYVWRRDVFMDNPRVFYDDTLLFEMPESRSVDIDTELDFEFVELLLTRQHAEIKS